MARPRRQSELPGAAQVYERLLAEQGGKCAICGAEPKTRKLHVDHEHKTGAVRGLLCYRCNRNLPTYASADWLEAAELYVRTGKARPDGAPWLTWVQMAGRA